MTTIPLNFMAAGELCVKNKPLADFIPTILLKAKDFATEITIFNAKDKQMKTEGEISNEHITNNKTIRNTLISRGFVPEQFISRRRH